MWALRRVSKLRPFGSRCGVTKVQSAVLEEHSKSFAEDDWNSIRSDLARRCRSTTASNVDAVILRYLADRHEPDMADVRRRFGEFLRKESGDFETVPAAVAVRLLPLYRGDEPRTLRLCDRLLSVRPAPDVASGSAAAQALASTSEWRRAVRLLTALRETDRPTDVAYGAVACAAFDADDADTARRVLTDATEDARVPPQSVYPSWTDHCLRLPPPDRLFAIEEMLRFVAEHEFVLREVAIRRLADFFRTGSEWAADIVTIDERGKCAACGRHLEIASYSVEELEKLRGELLGRAIVGDNEFAKSTPTETARFLRFLEETTPYDVVVDGLNVAFSTRKLDPARVVARTVRKLSEEHSRILVLGRKHMLKWSKESLASLKRDSSMFLTDDSSHDDPFLLYAALSSPDTFFVSRDLMRGHKFLLKDTKLKILFKRWQLSRQYFIEFPGNGTKVIIKEPFKYCTYPHKGNGWHIPYEKDDSKPINADSYELPKNWLCARPP